MDQRTPPSGGSQDRGEENGHAPEYSRDLQTLARELLEFPAITARLAAHTRFFLSREMALEVVPQSRAEDVERLQKETGEARLMLDSVGDIGLGGTEDPRPLLQRASLGGMLAGAELMRIVYLIESIRLAKSIVDSMGGRTQILESLMSDVPDLQDVTQRLRQSLADSGDVLDDSTPRLGPLRKKAARAYRQLTGMLERMTARRTIRAAIQSAAIAARGDRLVLEVKSECRKDVPGIVHDVSNTGATVFVEPFAAVDPCNRWRETAAEAQREEERVLRRLSRIVGARRQEILHALEAAAALDLITARARLAASMGGMRVSTLDDGDDTALRLLGARHPLLDGQEAVPVNISIGPGFRGLVITGPNTGGKTVALKTIGLLALMHQSGMQLPAAPGSALSVFNRVYADIGDAQSIERSVSTFSSHMGNVVSIVAEADHRSLVLLDELGTGTDPDEGSALARAILSYLIGRNIPTAITTHHRAVAEFASSVEGAVNASVELEPATMLPTYHFVTGIPGRSYALNVASRLGLPEYILRKARSMLDASHVSAERLLDELQSERNALRTAAIKAQEELAGAEAARLELERGLARVVRRQEDIVERTRSQLRREADAVRKELRRTLADAKRGSGRGEAQQAISRIRRQVSDPTWFPIAGIDEARKMKAAQAGQSPPASQSSPADTSESASTHPSPSKLESASPFAPGDLVEIKGLNVEAEVIGPDVDGAVDLRMGNARIRLSENQLRLVQDAENRDAPRESPFTVSAAETSYHSGSIDVRGYRVQQVQEELPRFIDRCLLDGVDSCKIIHGAGTGSLREAVRELLASSHGVTGFHPASGEHGGNGVTIAELGPA